MTEDYNQFMGGVDLTDQLLGTYAYPHKVTKWYHALYHRLREVALTNGYILYKRRSARVQSNLVFSGNKSLMGFWMVMFDSLARHASQVRMTPLDQPD